MRRALSTAALLCLAPLQLAQGARLRSCSDTGAGQHPTLRPGSYAVARQDGVDHLYFTDAKTGERKQLGDGEWGRTTGLATHGSWIYVIAAGHLLRANPETGEWFPKPRDGKGRCAFYEGWAGPLWVEKGALYGVKTSRERPDERMIARIDFDAAKGEIVGKYAPARAEVK